MRSTWSTSTLSTSRSPWGGTCRGSSCHSQRTPGVRPPSRCPPSPPWSSYTDRPAVLFDHILISGWSYTDTDPLLVFLTDHYCYACPSSSGFYTTIIKIKSRFLLQILFSLFNLDHKNSSSSTATIQRVRTMLSRFSSACLFLAVPLVSKDQFLVSLCSLPSFYMNSNLVWDLFSLSIGKTLFL